jgi:hypothetical protein
MRAMNSSDKNWREICENVIDRQMKREVTLLSIPLFAYLSNQYCGGGAPAVLLPMP